MATHVSKSEGTADFQFYSSNARTPVPRACFDDPLALALRFAILFPTRAAVVSICVACSPFWIASLLALVVRYHFPAMRVGSFGVCSHVMVWGND